MKSVVRHRKLLNDFHELETVILESCSNINKFIQMGYNAEKYYYENRTIEIMVDGFMQSINYVMGKRRKL